MRSARDLFLALLLAVTLAGCAASGESESRQSAPTTSATGGNAHFQIADLAIVGPRPGTLHEDDPNATIRYTIQQPTDAPGAQTAFVTFLLNGRILDVTQLKLAPGENKTYERLVTGLRDLQTVQAEVRAAGTIAKAHADILAWPRAAQGTLTLGPLTVRADHALLESDGRIHVNLTIDHPGPAQEIRDFRVKMLCITTQGTIAATKSVDVESPTLGNTTGVDVLVADCRHERYGLEFKARSDAGDLMGRLLFVPEGWRPASP